MADELKPCPFCGSPGPRYQMAWGVRCMACDASVPCRGGDFGPWNRRTPDLMPRADAELAVALVVERAAEIAFDRWASHMTSADRLGEFDDEKSQKLSEKAGIRADEANAIVTAILALAPADALADVQRLREERDKFAVTVVNLKQQRDAALARVERMREALKLYSCEDGCNDCPEHDRNRVGCGWTARAALDEDARHA